MICIYLFKLTESYINEIGEIDQILISLAFFCYITENPIPPIFIFGFEIDNQFKFLVVIGIYSLLINLALIEMESYMLKFLDSIFET